jgi:hypothetical protein
MKESPDTVLDPAVDPGTEQIKASPDKLGYPGIN